MAWMKQAQPLTTELTQKYQEHFSGNSHYVAMKNAAFRQDMKALASVPEAARKVSYSFSNTVQTMPVTNQKASGGAGFLRV